MSAAQSNAVKVIALSAASLALLSACGEPKATPMDDEYAGNSGESVQSQEDKSNTEGKAIEYKIEIYPVDAEDLKDVIYITVESVAINLETSYTMNGGEAVTVQNHTAVLTAKPGDELIFRENVLNSLGGITVGAYLVNGDSSTGVTSKTVSNLTPTGFVFTVPENKTGNVMIYKIEISPTEEESESLPSEKAPAPEKPVVMLHGLQCKHLPATSFGQ